MKAASRLAPVAIGLLCLAQLPSCTCGEKPLGGDAGPQASGSASAATNTSTAGSSEPASYSGSTIARTPAGDALYVADEDQGVLRRLSLPLSDKSARATIALPGPPAQLVALADRVLVTIRDPGLLLVMKPNADKGLVEEARVELPADAWGLAVTRDDKTALVSSAWTHTISAVDLTALTVRWSLDSAREPRGIVIDAAGQRAYVTHLTRSALTRVDDIGGAKATSKRIDLPTARSRAPHGAALSASLSYAAALSPDGTRLYVPRLALGALGSTSRQSRSWFGAGTVDVLLTANDSALAHLRQTGFVQRLVDLDPDSDYSTHPSIDDEGAPLPLSHVAPFTQPRAVVYRKKSDTLLVAAEGYDRVVELDARSIEPALHPLRYLATRRGSHDGLDVASAGGAPSGIVLSADEATAYVLCHATYDVVALSLPPLGADHDPEQDIRVRLAGDPLLSGIDDDDPRRQFREAAAIGRGLFHNATDAITSGGLSCAGCHPEGRDDGHTWHELKGPQTPGEIFVGSSAIIGPGKPRQTPMLAGRVDAKGPYGWHSESATLQARLKAGFGLHRWETAQNAHGDGPLEARASYLAAFLRAGLVPPPARERELTAVEQRGRSVFNSPAAGCTACHDPQAHYTDRAAVVVRVPDRSGFASDPNRKFKTPDLRFVAGTPPYFHNGSVITLEQLVFDNDDRMGKTNQLSMGDKAALVAFLKTL